MTRDKPRPTTRKLTAREREMMRAARAAFANGESIKPIAFHACRSKAEKAAYLRAHL